MNDSKPLFANFLLLQAFVENYGNASGIPDNWDGRMYGGIYNPLVLSFAIFLCIYGIVAMPIAVATIVVLKFIPVYLKAEWEAAKRLNPLVAIPQFWWPMFVVWFKAGTIKNYVAILVAYFGIAKEGCGTALCSDDDECPKEFKITCCWWIYIPATLLWVLCWPFALVGPFFFYIGWLAGTIIIGPIIWLMVLVSDFL